MSTATSNSVLLRNDELHCGCNMDGKQFNLPREIKCSDLVAECTSRFDELHKIIRSISFETWNENIVKVQRLKLELGELQSSVQKLFEQMNKLKRTSSNGTTTEAASQTNEATLNPRGDKSQNTEPIPNDEKRETVILHWIHDQAKLMRIENDEHWPTQRNQSLTTINVPQPIDNCIKNDSRSFAVAHTRPHILERINEKSHFHSNKLSRITASYEMEIRKLDRKLQSSFEKYTNIKCCAVILLDIIDHLKRKLRSTQHNQKVGEVADKWTISDVVSSRDTKCVVVEPLNRPINKISVKSVGSNSVSLSEEQIELLDKELIQNDSDNDNESKSEVLVERTTSCRRQHGFISNEFNFKKDKSIQTDRKFNHDENIVDEEEEEEEEVEQDFCRNFNYHLNGSELLAMTKKSNSKQSGMVRQSRKIDGKRNFLLGRQLEKTVPHNVKLMRRSNVVAVATATNSKKDAGDNAVHVLGSEINKTTTVSFKQWPNRKTNSSRTIQAGTLHHSTKQTNQQKSILRSSGTRKTVSNKVADAAYKMTHADEKETIVEAETKTKLTLKPKPKPKLKTLVKHHINNNMKETPPRAVSENSKISNRKGNNSAKHITQTQSSKSNWGKPQVAAGAPQR